MPEQDREQLVEQAVEAMILALKRYDPTLYEKESWDITLCNIKPIVRSVLATFASILPPTTSAGELEICPNCSGSGVGIADTTCTRCDGCGGVRPSAGDGELIKRLRKAGRFNRACNPSNSATVTGSVVVSLYDEAADRLATLSAWAEGPSGVRWYTDRHAELTARVKELEEALVAAEAKTREEDARIAGNYSDFAPRNDFNRGRQRGREEAATAIRSRIPEIKQ